ncbi:hypothetical protein EV137_6291 [Kribbella pratensis]|uniref:DUF4232 domain-containing protein n=1 Tax=Kribbella pratensis TaxID=2512112 RepID=A0ABY2FCK9_9ACTN|nr:hypothetical protein [Kribbella pratensis]TDW88197.1 hypothetical protein EV137_6291 [Kribbella pratensis]
MEDVQEVSAELHRLAESEAMDPLDTTRMLERGRRGRRRRKLIGAGGAVAGVAVIAVGASLLPSLSSADNQPGVAKNPPEQFSSVPGVPRGEAGADQRITMDEAQRRCDLRNPTEKRKLRGTKGARSGHVAMYDIKIGEKRNLCIVPGGDRPSADLIAAADKDPMPKSTAGKLRNCSVLAWVDVTGWQVVASDESKTLGQAEVVAISPTGHKVMECALRTDVPFRTGLEGNTTFATLTNLTSSDPVLNPADKSARTDMYAAGGGGGPCKAGACSGWGMTGWGRVASKDAAAVRLRIGNGPIYQVPVGEGGWFAFTWKTAAKYKQGTFPKVAAYTKAGKVVKVFE